MKKLLLCIVICCLCIPVSALATQENQNLCTEGSKPDCAGVCNGDAVFDDCNVCDGFNKDKDDCGVCFGGNRDLDDCGICFGNNAAKDSCGVCFGNDAAIGCDGACFSNTRVECGICTSVGVGCQLYCEDVVPPAYYRSGMTMGCLPAFCADYQFNVGWAVVASGCPGTYAVAPGTLITGTLCGCIRQSEMGCFTPDAKILTTSGERRIDSLKAGDYVVNPVTGKETAILKVVQSAEKDPLVRFGYQNESITVTRTHPVYTQAGIKKARDLKEGDVIMTATGEFRAITFLEYLEPRYGQQVFNLVLDTPLSLAGPEVSEVSMGELNPEVNVIDNLVVADGIVTGDMTVQVLINQE